MKFLFHHYLLKYFKLESKIYVLWKKVYPYLQKDLAHIWEDWVHRNFKQIDDLLEKILFVLKRIRDHYGMNETQYKREIEEIKELESHLRRMELKPDSKIIHKINSEMLQLITEIERQKKEQAEAARKRRYETIEGKKGLICEWTQNMRFFDEYPDLGKILLTQWNDTLQIKNNAEQDNLVRDLFGFALPVYQESVKKEGLVPAARVLLGIGVKLRYREDTRPFGPKLSGILEPSVSVISRHNILELGEICENAMPDVIPSLLTHGLPNCQELIRKHGFLSIGNNLAKIGNNCLSAGLTFEELDSFFRLTLKSGENQIDRFGLEPVCTLLIAVIIRLKPGFRDRAYIILDEEWFEIFKTGVFSEISHDLLAVLDASDVSYRYPILCGLQHLKILIKRQGLRTLGMDLVSISRDIGKASEDFMFHGLKSASGIIDSREKLYQFASEYKRTASYPEELVRAYMKGLSRSVNLNNFTQFHGLFGITNEYYEFLGRSEYACQIIEHGISKIDSLKGRKKFVDAATVDVARKDVPRISLQQKIASPRGTQIIAFGDEYTGYLIRVMNKMALEAWKKAIQVGIESEEILQTHSQGNNLFAVLTKFYGDELRFFGGEMYVGHKEISGSLGEEIGKQHVYLYQKLIDNSIRFGKFQENGSMYGEEKPTFCVEFSGNKPIVRVFDFSNAVIS